MSVGCTKYRCVDGPNDAAIAVIPIRDILKWEGGGGEVKWLYACIDKDIFIALLYHVHRFGLFHIWLAVVVAVAVVVFFSLFHVANHSQCTFFLV